MSLDTEQVALRNARADALNFAIDLEELAAALRAVAGGHADRGAVALVRGNVDMFGDLILRASTDWAHLLAHARPDR